MSAITVQDQIYSLKPEFDSVLVDSSMSFEREAGFAIQVLTANDYAMGIARSNPQSVRNAVINTAAIGISLNPAKKQAYLVPRDGKICLDISYMGLIDMATDSGSVKWAQSSIVYEKDTFELVGIDKPPIHKCDPFLKDRGAIVGVYVTVKTHDGDYLTHTMPIDAVWSVRDRSAAWRSFLKTKKSCPWVTDEGEMIKKTCVKQAYKYWPKTERLEQAIHHLNTDGDEGITIDAPEVTGFDAVEACNKINEAKDLKELETLWKEYGALATKAKDRGGYGMVKNAVLEKKAAIEAAP
jgi:recombination protein RecT